MSGKRSATTPHCSLGQFLYALSFSEHGRVYLRHTLDYFKHLSAPMLWNTEMRLGRIACEHHVPEGATDVCRLAELPAYTLDRSHGEINLWISALLRASQHPQHIREVGLKLGDHSTETELSALSLNVWGLPEVLGDGAAERSRLERVATELNRLSADIVCLQEVWSGSRGLLLEQLRYPYVCAADKRAGLLGCSGLVTLSKLPIVESAFVPFSYRPGLEWFARKGVLFTRVRLPHDRIVDVYNVHLFSEPERMQKFLVSTDFAYQARATQLREVADLIRASRAPGSTVLVLGDFNVPEHHPQYECMRALLGLDIYRRRNGSISQAGLPDKRAGEELERRRGFTFDPLRNKLAARHHDKCERLDYGFVQTGSMRSAVYRSQRLWTEKPLSDHYGVFFSLKFLS